MIYQGHKKEENGWNKLVFSTTWKYGYDFMLDAVQEIIDSGMKDNVQYFSFSKMPNSKNENYIEELKKAEFIIRNCKSLSEECSFITIAGINNLIHIPFQIYFYNQTNKVTLNIPGLVNDSEMNFEKIFSNYLNGIEINAYCKDTERRTIEKLKNK